MAGIRARKLICLLAATAIFLVAFLVLPAAVSAQTVASSGSSVGAVVDQIPTTTLPPSATTTVPTATPPTTGAPAVQEEPTQEPVLGNAPAEEPSPFVQETAAAPENKGVMAVVKSAVEESRRFVKSVLAGKPVADAINDVLPSQVASVVVPAIRTASTFVFPIGLAAGVFAFLILQQRIDSSDPKLTAAPLAHDDDVIEFR